MSLAQGKQQVDKARQEAEKKINAYLDVLKEKAENAKVVKVKEKGNGKYRITVYEEIPLDPNEAKGIKNRVNIDPVKRVRAVTYEVQVPPQGAEVDKIELADVKVTKAEERIYYLDSKGNLYKIDLKANKAQQLAGTEKKLIEGWANTAKTGPSLSSYLSKGGALPAKELAVRAAAVEDVVEARGDVVDRRVGLNVSKQQEVKRGMKEALLKGKVDLENKKIYHDFLHEYMVHRFQGKSHDEAFNEAVKVLPQNWRDRVKKVWKDLRSNDPNARERAKKELKKMAAQALREGKFKVLGVVLGIAAVAGVGIGLWDIWRKTRGAGKDKTSPTPSSTPAITYTGTKKSSGGASPTRTGAARAGTKRTKPATTGSPVEENELKRKDEVEDPAKAIAYGISTASRITLDYGLPRKYRGKNYIGGVNGLTTGYDVWRTAFTLYSYGMALKNDEGLKEKVIERVAKDLAEREGLSDKEAYKKAKALVERFIATTTSDRYRKSLIEKDPAKVKYNKSLRDAIMYFQEMGRHALAGEDVFVPEGADMSGFAYEKMHVDGYFGAESLSAAVAFGRLLAQFREGEKPQQPQEEESTEEEEGQRREEEEAEKKELAAFLGTLSERQPKEALLSLRGFSQEDYDRLLSAEGWEQAEGRWYKKVGPYTFQYDPTISTLNVYTNDPRKVSGEPILTLTRVASGWDVVWHDEGYKRKGGAEGGVVERTPIHPTQKGVKGYWELIREMGYYRAEERLAENTTVYIPVEYVSDDVIYAAKKGKTFPHRLGEDIPLKKAIRVELVERNGKQYIKVNAKDLINFDGEHAKAFFNEKGQEVIKNALKGSRNIEKSPDFKETIMWKLGRIDWGRSYRSLIKGITAMGGDVVVNSPTTFRGKEYGELIFRYAGGNYFLEGVSTSTGGGGEVAPLTTPSSQASTQVQRNEGQERTQQEGTQEGQREELAVKAAIRDNKLYLEIDGVAVEQALEEEWGKTLSKALGEWRKKAGDNYGILANVSLPTTEEWEPYGNVVCWGSACTTILRKGDTLYAVYFLKRGNTVEVETQEVPSQLLS